MALATRCPNCHALFRVVADQLKLRGGLVRCGACRHVFDAIGTLSYLDDASLRPAAPAAPAPSDSESLRIPPPHPTILQDEVVNAARKIDLASSASATGGVEVPHAASDTAETPDETPVPAQSGYARSRELSVEQHGTEVPELAGAAQFDFGDKPAEGASDISIEPQIETGAHGEATSGPSVAVVDDAADGMKAPAEDVAFLKEGAPARSRLATSAYAAGIAFLFIALALQSMQAFRAEIGARWPTVRPLLVRLCEAMHCTVGWPKHGEMLAVVGSELQALPGVGALELTAVVRNRADVTLALPAIELTLTDTQDRAIARKVFAPADYLAPGEAASRLASGIEAGADITVRLVFQARGLNVAGFVVYPFYI